MRGAPQVGFSATIRKIKTRTSLLTRFRPPTRLNLEIHAQYKRNPARCQFTTVRGVTKTRGFLHPDQNVLNASQNSLCRAVNRVRGRSVCKASSCRRRAKFSRTRSSRERKELRMHPRRCRSDTIMARILSELSEFSFALSHSFCRCTMFWRNTGIGSHCTPETPGSIHEGGELGYVLSHACGAAFDNPELIVAAVVGDGESETGPLATSWHINKFLSPVRDGAVLPILHLNGYKINNPTLLARIPGEELQSLLS